ncbi:hypothetical protein J2T57_001541 [Natronocella acetinitrilica]|uniref:Uncharacterized protein n=1 Tax=Natronocella acetinitrilica TaxID=414046 RepID=A0AAE3G2I2_9GAMM|nr:hypothetical protein [Natronocella acetinitrilica]MCP1674439.1 hypothetical protein [Natronocella acetinitrilica]
MRDQDGLAADFPQLIEALLAGGALCEYRHPRLHRLVCEPDSAERLEAERILERLGRVLRESDGVYYAAFDGLDASVEEAVSRQFTRYLDDEPLITEFTELLRQSLTGGEVLVAGDRFRFDAALSRITASQAHRESLQRLAALVQRQGKVRDRSPDEALRRVVNALTDRGYLFESSREAQEYVLTGEYQLFAHWLAFALDQEGFVDQGEDAEDNRAQAQEQLL